MQSQKIFWVNTPGPSQQDGATPSSTQPHQSAPVLGPRHQFPLGSPAFLFFLFYQTTTSDVVTQNASESILTVCSISLCKYAHAFGACKRMVYKKKTNFGESATVG